MTAGMVSVYALAALLGLAPTVLQASLSRAGIKLGSNRKASESDLAKVFGPMAAHEFVRRAKDSGWRRSSEGPGI